jgi:SagB-type dehydrogenase family enzyme
MNRVSFLIRRLILPYLLSFPAIAVKKELTPILLPQPQIAGGKPLMQTLNERRSLRRFGPQPLTLTVLSSLLWAASGVNRVKEGKRTAPTAGNRQAIDIYAVMTDGVYLYDAKSHYLSPILGVDIRTLAGRNRFVSEAPVNLVFVADFTLFNQKNESDKILYSAADTGFVSQNVYLFCASEGMATCVCGNIDRVSLAKAIKLKPEQKIILTQSIGFATERSLLDKSESVLD